MPTFLHAADLHLDSPLRGLDATAGVHAERIRLATRIAFERMVSRALELRVAFALIAGDVYDTQPCFETYRFFHRQVERLTRAGIPVAIVLGNHDHAGIAPRSGRLPAGVHVFASTPETIEIVAGVRVHGQSYPRRDVREDLSAGYPRPQAGMLDIGLLHTALDGYSGEHKVYAPSHRQALANHGYAYWALGHVHRQQIVRAERDVPIVYPGNLQGRHARETGAKGAVFVDYQDGRIGDIRPEAFDDVRWHQLSIDTSRFDEVADALEIAEEQVREATAQARDGGRLAAVRISLTGEAPTRLGALGSAEIRDTLRVRLGGDAGLFIEKIEVELAARAGNRSEADAQLQALVGDLAGCADERLALAEIARKLGDRLRKTDPDLLAAEPGMGPWTAPMDEALARARLGWALALVRERLHTAADPR